MNVKNISVWHLLRRYKLYTDEINNICFHLGVQTYDAYHLAWRIAGVNDLKEKELAQLIYQLILKCDVDNPDYDPKLDEEMTRIGCRTREFRNKKTHYDLDTENVAYFEFENQTKRL